MRKPKRDLTIEEQLSRGPMDLPFLMILLLLVGIGLVVVFSASYASAYYDVQHITGHDPTYFIRNQAIYAVIGLVFMYIISKINYQTLRWLSIFALGFSFLCMLLIMVPGLGVKVNGATRWLKIPGVPQFQPSEVMKVGVILYFSSRLAKRNTEKKLSYDQHKPKGRLLHFSSRIGLTELLPYGAILVAIVLLLRWQRHTSATILILLVGASILFAAGIRLGWFVAGGTLAVGAMTFIILGTSYMSNRIEMWQNPWADPLSGGYQAIQSLYAIGSGGLLGVGLGNSRQKFLYIPEPQNDFVFSIACEELGFIGAGLILILFALLIIRGYWLAIHARDRFGTLLIVGVTTQVAVQVFLNIGVVTNFFPVTGISLPFFSYGGTALIIQLAEMGVVLAVSRQIPAPRQG